MCTMLRKMLAGTGRGVASTVLQTHTMQNSTIHCSIFLSWMINRNTGAYTPPTSPHTNPSNHFHTSTSSHMKNCDIHYYLDTRTRFQGNQRQSYSAQTRFQHKQTITTQFLPPIATRGLATLSMAQPDRKNIHESLPGWSPRGVVRVGGVVVGVKGLAKDSGGYRSLQGRISSLQVKKRVQRKKKKIQEDLDEEWQVTAYATADEYDLEALLDGLTRQGLYSATPFTSTHSTDTQTSPPDPHTLPDPSEVLHVMATYHLESEPREIYFFQSGAVVFWNVAELERNSVLRFLRRYQKGGHDERTVKEECESLIYTYTNTPSRTKLVRDTIFLNPEGATNLEKYSFSNALSVSVQLGIWEAALDEYIENIEYVSEELSKTGLVVLSQDQVLQRMGQLFALRHLVNLSSDLLDVPDFYWEHENLEQLYRKTSDYLSVSKRTSVMNVKLSHCVELMELLKSHLNERHSARLEWIIIILIMVEVGFELLHFLERLF